jgi:hypothetical protein
MDVGKQGDIRCILICILKQYFLRALLTNLDRIGGNTSSVHASVQREIHITTYNDINIRRCQ